MRTLSKRALAPLFLAALGAVLPGCAHYNSHGRQGLPHAWRIVTVPGEARVIFPGHGNLLYISPADIDGKLGPLDRVIIEKDGYESFDGKLGELVQVAQGTYECRLVPR